MMFEALLLVAVFIGPQIGYGIYKLMIGWDIRRDDEQEHRQQLERQQAKHRQKLEAAEKLREVLSLLIVDPSSADVIRGHLDENFPKVRVQTVEEEEEPEPRKKRRGAKR